jgi:CheY-like chemotaxis protein
MTTPTLLHVDDDADLLRQSAISLAAVGEDADLAVETVADPSTALDRLAAGDVACLVSDSLRTADGESFVAAARRAAPDVPVVLFTGKRWRDAVPEATATGVAGYVHKGAGAFQRLASVVEHRTAAAEDGWTVVGVHDPASGRELAVTVAEALASLVGVSPLDFPSLYAAVDGEALEALVESEPSVRVEFTLEDLRVAVDGEGAVAVRSRDDVG